MDEEIYRPRENSEAPLTLKLVRTVRQSTKRELRVYTADGFDSQGRATQSVVLRRFVRDENGSMVATGAPAFIFREMLSHVRYALREANDRFRANDRPAATT